MKNIIVLAFVFMSSVSAFAMFGGNPVSNIPNEFSSPDSGWSVFMTEKACKVRFKGEVSGASQRLSGGDVLYSVFNSKGKVVLQAIAADYSRYAKTECLRYVKTL